MTSRPTQYFIVGQKVIDEVNEMAPTSVEQTFVDILRALERGPYPGDNMLHCVEARGFSYPNTYITWHDDLLVLYQVMVDQPVISLVGVTWTPPRRSIGEDTDDES